MIFHRIQNVFRRPLPAAPRPATVEEQSLSSGTGLDTIMACHDCDLLNRLPREAAATLLCARCGAVLTRHRPNSIERSLALSLAALILFVLSNSFPFLAMKNGGLIQETTLLTGIHELWKQELYGLSFLVLLTCVLVPLFQMVGLLSILVPLRLGLRPAAHASHVLRLIQEVAPWGMMEVFMMGFCCPGQVGAYGNHHSRHLGLFLRRLDFCHGRRLFQSGSASPVGSSGSAPP